MRNPHKYRLDNPAFNEFVYSILYNASFEAKRVIPPKYLKFIKYEREAKKFARNASHEEARVLLSYLGVEHFDVFVARDNANIKDLKVVLDKFKNNKKIGSLEDIIALKLFVTSDKELITLLGLVSQTIHHRAYTMNLELTRTGYHIRNWGKHLGQAPANEILENSNILAKTLLSSSLTLDRVEFLFRLNALEIKVLLYLYPLKSGYVSLKQLSERFVGLVTKVKLTNCLKHLLASQHIQKSAIASEREYTISALGVRVVNDYMDTILRNNSF